MSIGLLLYVSVSGLLAAMAVGFLGMVYIYRRHLLLKPSFVILTFYVFLIQLPAVFISPSSYSFFPRPWEFVLLVHGFATLGLVGAFFIAQAPSRRVWDRVTAADYPSTLPGIGPITILGSLIAAVTLIYLREVPFSQTGFAVIFTDPARAVAAREYALKLLDDPLIRYGFAFLTAAFAPLSAGVLSLRLIRTQSRLERGLLLISLLVLVVLVSLPGARGPAVEILLVAFLVWFVRQRLRVNPMTIATSVVLVLSVPALWTILRQGYSVTFNLWYEMLTGPILRRIFVSPMELGTWYVHHMQSAGPVGIAGIARLAELLNTEAINLPNYIGLHYSPTTLLSVNANAGYMFTFYAYMGIVSLPISLAALWVLDLAVLLYDELADFLLLPTITAVSVASISFIASDYTPSLVTHGFLIIVLLALAMQLTLTAPSVERTPPAPA